MSVVISNERIAMAFAQALDHHKGDALAARRTVAAALEIVSQRVNAPLAVTPRQEVAHERR